MAAQNFRVIFTESAWEHIGEVVRYWTDRDESERGGDDQELPVYGLQAPPYPLHLLKEADGIVEVLRFWHGHRDEPLIE